MYTVTKAYSVTQEHSMRVAANSVIHVDRSEKSIIHKDFAALPSHTCCAPASGFAFLTVIANNLEQKKLSEQCLAALTVNYIFSYFLDNFFHR
jgi:hypothetical protein